MIVCEVKKTWEFKFIFTGTHLLHGLPLFFLRTKAHPKIFNSFGCV